ncbi:MAG TPA: zinc-binding dehydrogenase [Pseudonocardia sp.]|nr:zinc-binding dehydrogenase [Pseudonocardia sp.]
MPRAAVCTAQNEPLTVMDLRLDPPRQGEVRLRLAAAALCGSDVSVQAGHLPSPMPVVLGHEGVGEVTETGPGVRSLRAGDQVVVAAMPQCGRCARCTHEQPFLCEVGDVVLKYGGLRSGDHRFSTADGTGVAQMVAAGTFAEEIVVPEISCVQVPAAVDPLLIAPLGCGVITGYGAARRAATIRPWHTVVVIGCGTVGLAAVQGARLAGAERIVAVDVTATKTDLAKRLGATESLTADQDVVAAVRELTGGRGADVVLECVGAQATVKQAVRMTAKGGEVVFVGAGGPDVRLDVAQFAGLVGPAKTFRGVLFGAADIHRDIPEMVREHLDGRLLLEETISHRVTLDEVDATLGRLGEPDLVTAVVDLR